MLAAVLALTSASTVFAQAALTLPQAVAEALQRSPALRAPEDSRALAEIRERQAAAAFGLKLTPSFESNAAPSALAQRSFGLAVSKRLELGTTLGLDVNLASAA